MSLRVLIIPDKFKGTLTAREAAEAIAAGWRSARPQDRLQLLPMSDGGDGFGELLSHQLSGQTRWVRTVNAAHRPIRAPWWLAAQSATAIIESAKIVGLAMLPPGKFHPSQLDTFGLAAVLRRAVQAGAKRAVVGVGGSATNDGGFGLARGLGWKFRDQNGLELAEWRRLDQLAQILPSAQLLPMRITIAADVQNVLLGPRGCSRIYGPQKGLRPGEIPWADKRLRRLALCLKEQLGLDFANLPGAGAAGGLGFGLMVFAGATMERGFDLFAQFAKIKKRIRACDLVITGEGKIDRQTYMGKAVGQIGRMCRELKIPCIALAGAAPEAPPKGGPFARTEAMADLTTAMAAQRRPRFFLRRLARQSALRETIWLAKPMVKGQKEHPE